jgi:hypothetical protein
VSFYLFQGEEWEKVSNDAISQNEARLAAEQEEKIVEAMKQEDEETVEAEPAGEKQVKRSSSKTNVSQSKTTLYSSKLLNLIKFF